MEGRDPAAGSSWQSRLRGSSWVVDSVVTAVLGTIVFVIGFGNPRRMTGPLGDGDLVSAYATAKVWSEGAPFGNATFGYPFGMESRYFPSTDFLFNAIAGPISAISGNPFVGLNLVYALSFPVTALAALWVFRIVGVHGPIAIFSSLAFTAIPFHWLRVEHLYLGTMYSVVLGVGLALLTATGSIELHRLNGRRRWQPVAVLATLCLVIATSGIYNACFTIMLCLAGLVYRLAHGPSWRGALMSAIPMIGVIVLTGAALLPSTIFLRSHPPLRTVADRNVLDSVVYSGNLAFALVPAPVTQIPGLKQLNPSIEKAFTVANRSRFGGAPRHTNFGSWFTALALALAGVGLFRSVRRAALGAPSRERAPSRELPTSVAKQDVRVSFGLVGLLLATTVMFFVPWGLNVAFAALVTPQIRAWERLTPVLFLLFFTGAMVAWRSMGMPQKGIRAVLVATVCGVLLVFDSVVPYRAFFAEATSKSQATLRAGRQYGAALNTAIPRRCGMLELPNQPFPEEPNLRKLKVHDAYWPALTNPGKDWSFGAMKGTVDSEWQRVLGADLDQAAISDLLDGGFCGIHVDRRGLTPDEEVQVTKRLTALLGKPVATGHGGDWTAYALPATGPHQVLNVLDAARLGDRLATFYYPPLIASRARNTVVAERDAFGPRWRATAARTELTIRSLDPSAEFSTVTGTVRAVCSPRDVTLGLRTNDETFTTSFHLEPGTEHDFVFRLPAKATSANLVVNAPGAACRNPADQRLYTVALRGVKAR